jgi:hypothetical protein
MERKSRDRRETGMNVSSTARDSHRGRDEERHPMGAKAFYARSRARRAGILATLVATMWLVSAAVAAPASAQAPPNITSLNPTGGPAVGGNSVVITGTEFTGTFAVFFGSNAVEFTVDSDTQITATVPAGIAGTTVDVIVQTSFGDSPNDLDDDYAYDAGPADGVGTASARGALGTNGGYSAITNCDEAQNTRPFIVRFAGMTFKRTSTATSTCTSNGSTSVNEGTGAGTLDGTPYNLSWRFTDSPDTVEFRFEPTDPSHCPGCLAYNFTISQPQPLNGSPGGIWVFGTLRWPAT